MSNKHSTDKRPRLAPEDRRDQIVAVAAEHFARLGYDAVSLAAVAAEAGIARALVYHYFAGKERLLEAVLRREAQELLDATDPDLSLTPRQNLERAVNAYLDHYAASKGELRSLYAPSPSTPAVVRDIKSSHHPTHLRRLRTGLGLADEPQVNLALSAWLSFLLSAADDLAQTEGIRRTAVLDLCIRTLQAAVGVDLDAALRRPDSRVEMAAPKPVRSGAADPSAASTMVASTTH